MWGNCFFGMLYLVWRFRFRCRVGVFLFSCHSRPWLLWLRVPHFAVRSNRTGRWYDFTYADRSRNDPGSWHDFILFKGRIGTLGKRIQGWSPVLVIPYFGVILKHFHAAEAA